MCVCLRAKLLQSCPTLCHRMDYSPPGSSVHRILQARTLGWAAISFSSRSFNPGIALAPPEHCSIGTGVLYTRATWEATPRLFFFWGRGKVVPEVVWTHGKGSLILTYDTLVRPAAIDNFYTIYKLTTLLHPLICLAFAFWNPRLYTGRH